MYFGAVELIGTYSKYNTNKARFHSCGKRSTFKHTFSLGYASSVMLSCIKTWVIIFMSNALIRAKYLKEWNWPIFCSTTAPPSYRIKNTNSNFSFSSDKKNINNVCVMFWFIFSS